MKQRSDLTLNKEPIDSDPFWGSVIHCYTRAQAIADGVLIDVTETAKEAGFKWPVALARGAWDDCVAWSEDDNRIQTHQDESGRLWDCLWMAQMSIRRSENNDGVLFYEFYRIPRDGKSWKIRKRQLKLIAGPGDQGEPVITILLPQED